MLGWLSTAFHEAPAPHLSRGTATGFLRFAARFWSGRTGRRAWLWTGGAAGLLLLNLAVSLGLNQWHRWFFDMLERREIGQFPAALATLAILLVSGAGFAVAMVKCRMTLQVEWRQWVTLAIIRVWIARSRAGSLDVAGENHGSPAYRLAEDVRLALDPVVELTIGFANAVIQGLTFFGILVIVGGSLSFTVFGLGLIIPAYLALAAVAYASLMSLAMFLIGRPLVRRVGHKNEAEARFLFELTRLAEGTAQPPAYVHRIFAPVLASFHQAVRRWKRVIREHCRLTWLTNSNSYLSPIIPLVLATPKYVTGELSLGAVMQLAAAFTAVLGALNWVTDNYIRLAEWSASARRADELRHALSKPHGNTATVDDMAHVRR